VTRDPLDDPGINALFGHLTSGPTADERSGEHAALTMFRSAQFRPPGEEAAIPVRTRRPHRRTRVGGRLVAAAMALAVLGGFAAAAYAEVLPAPLQRVAHDLLGGVGVPNAPNHPPVHPSTTISSTRPRSGRTGSAAPSPSSPLASSPAAHSHSPRSHSPSPHPSAPPGSRRLTIAVSLVPGPRSHSYRLLVAVPHAQRDDAVELEVLTAGQWRVTRSHRLRRTGRTAFALVARKISVTYRVVLLATTKHGESISGPVTVPARRLHRLVHHRRVTG